MTSMMTAMVLSALWASPVMAQSCPDFSPQIKKCEDARNEASKTCDDPMLTKKEGGEGKSVMDREKFECAGTGSGGASTQEAARQMAQCYQQRREQVGKHYDECRSHLRHIRKACDLASAGFGEQMSVDPKCVPAIQEAQNKISQLQDEGKKDVLKSLDKDNELIQTEQQLEDQANNQAGQSLAGQGEGAKGSGVLNSDGTMTDASKDGLNAGAQYAQADPQATSASPGNSSVSSGKSPANSETASSSKPGSATEIGGATSSSGGKAGPTMTDASTSAPASSAPASSAPTQEPAKTSVASGGTGMASSEPAAPASNSNPAPVDAPLATEARTHDGGSTSYASKGGTGTGGGIDSGPATAGARTPDPSTVTGASAPAAPAPTAPAAEGKGSAIIQADSKPAPQPQAANPLPPQGGAPLIGKPVADAAAAPTQNSTNTPTTPIASNPITNPNNPRSSTGIGSTTPGSGGNISGGGAMAGDAHSSSGGSRSDSDSRSGSYGSRAKRAVESMAMGLFMMAGNIIGNSNSEGSSTNITVVNNNYNPSPGAPNTPPSNEPPTTPVTPVTPPLNPSNPPGGHTPVTPTPPIASNPTDPNAPATPTNPSTPATPGTPVVPPIGGVVNPANPTDPAVPPVVAAKTGAGDKAIAAGAAANGEATAAGAPGAAVDGRAPASVAVKLKNGSPQDPNAPANAATEGAHDGAAIAEGGEATSAQAAESANAPADESAIGSSVKKLIAWVSGEPAPAAAPRLLNTAVGGFTGKQLHAASADMFGKIQNRYKALEPTLIKDP